MSKSRVRSNKELAVQCGKLKKQLFISLVESKGLLFAVFLGVMLFGFMIEILRISQC